MKRIHQLIGGAGTGKTTRNMRSIAEITESGIQPMEILFSSFTKVARQTAASRAEAITGYSASQLISEGWFKTLQAVCYKCLGVSGSSMISDNKASRQWLSDLFDADFSKQSLDSEDGYVVEDGMSDNAIASVLKEWNIARMMLITADDESRWPVKSMDKQKAMAVIDRYERQKYIDGKLDFADLALKFVGIRHEIHGLTYYQPECGVPDVAACIFDEYQDTPELLHRVALRIAESPRVEQVIVSGDPFQCQPAGTPVLTSKGFKAIEDLDPETDRLVSYDKTGGRFTGFAGNVRFEKAWRFVNSGDLVELTFSDGTKSVCTLNHKWLVRTVKKERYATYLMKKGDRWRIGTVQLFSSNPSGKNGEFRLKMRMNQEDAECAWILKVFKTDREARMYEQIASYKYGIPQVTFRPPAGVRTNLNQEFIDTVFSSLGNLDSNGLRCLRDHKLKFDFPYSVKADNAKNGQLACRFIATANIIPGLHVVPRLKEDYLQKRPKAKSGQRVRWDRRFAKSLEWIDIVSVKHLRPGSVAKVYSLEVPKYHTYVTTNGVVTGNCIFGFIGSDHQFLMRGFDYTHREVMHQSHRCAKKILELGEKAIRNCSDYFDRGIKPKEEDGILIPHTARTSNPIWMPGADEDWLIVGRTNFAVARITKWLTENDVPWIASDNGGAGYVGPRKRRVGETLWRIRNGFPINGNEWAYAIGDIPATYNGEKFLQRGVKTAASSADWHCPQSMRPDDLLTNGATEAFLKVVRESDWSVFDPAFAKFLKVANKHSIDLAIKPKIRASTIHGAKGDEADNVLLYTQSSGIVRSASKDTRKVDEEHRTWYVGATRARDVLTLFKFAGDKPGYF